MRTKNSFLKPHNNLTKLGAVSSLGLAALLGNPARIHGQSTSNPNGVDPALVTKLLQRVEDLERKASRVDALEAQLNALKSNGAPASSEPEPNVVRETYPKIQFNVLGDVDFHVSNQHNDKNTFILGDFDPVINAKLSEKAGVLADFVVASDANGFAFEVERLLLQYSFNDYFNIEAGRFHTAIGYYNNTFHNGTYFQTTVERPSIYLFEDGEGILPVHSTGISLNGDIPSGKLRLHYVAEIANGRDYDIAASPFRIEDDNDHKAVNFALSAKPEWLPGLQVGGSAYFDTLTPQGLPRTDQLVLSAYGVYKTPTFEWLNEGVFLRHTPSGGEAHWTSAAYTQVSRKFGKFRPYARLQWRNSPENDAILQLIDQNVSIWGPTIGIRYDFTPMMAVKGEYEHTERRGDLGFDEFTLQWTFRF